MLDAKSESLQCNLTSGLLGFGPIRDFVVIRLNLAGPGFSMANERHRDLLTSVQF